MARKGNMKKPKQSTVARRRSASAQSAMPARVLSHLRMLMDPCNAVLSKTAYRGKDGFLNRFVSTEVTKHPGDTVGVVAYWPRFNRVFRAVFGNETDIVTLNFYGPNSTAGPGGAFLGTNAGETRPVAACLTSQFTGTELDRQGVVLQGVLPNRTTTGSLSIGQLRQLMQRVQRTPDHVVETKWIPTASDEEYEQIPGADPGISVAGDDNIIVHIFTGFAAGKLQFETRVTAVQEWQPYYGLGIVCPTPNTDDPPAGLEHVRTFLSRAGHWWLEAVHTAGTAMRVGAGVYNSTRALAAGATRMLAITAA